MGGGGGGETYGSTTAPVNLGSGGYSGDHGGGAIKLSIGGNLANSGTISATGENVSNYGGGSGGSVWVDFTGGNSTWSGTNGTISADANIYAGGGRVAITGYTSDTHTGNVTTYGGGADCTTV